MYILLYLLAIVIANLLITQFGPILAIPVAFLCIGFDLTSRDRLHDAWQGKGLLWKMGLLIGSGSALSWLLNQNAKQVAIASFAAFTAAACVDTLVYHLLRDKAHLFKVNGSNLFSATVDSVVFPTLAFGGFLPWVTLGQFAAKVLGGLLWSLILQTKVVHERNLASNPPTG